MSEVKRFSDFAKESLPLEGEKISISELLNRPIRIINHKVSQSKKREGTKYVTLQLILDGKKYVAFTGSSVLISQTEQYAQYIPFETTIKKINDFYTFT